MRRSSSTISRWGASSAGAVSGAVISRSQRLNFSTPQSCASARLVGALDEFQHAGTLFRIDHGRQEAPGSLVRTGAEPIERAGDPLGLQTGKLQRERAALVGDVQQALTAIVGAFFLNDVTLVHQLFEHAPKRLLGDAQ